MLQRHLAMLIGTTYRKCFVTQSHLRSPVQFRAAACTISSSSSLNGALGCYAVRHSSVSLNACQYVSLFACPAALFACTVCTVCMHCLHVLQHCLHALFALFACKLLFSRSTAASHSLYSSLFKRCWFLMALHCKGVGYKSDSMTYCTNKLYGLMFGIALQGCGIQE